MPRRLAMQAAMLLCASSLALVVGDRAAALDLAGTAWETAAQPYGLDPSLLYAIAIMESGRARDGGLAPWPWTLWIPQQGGRFFASEEEALATLRANAAAGVDIGLMQVNLRQHGHRVDWPEELLEPQRNLEVAAGILAEAVRSAPRDLELGIGRYHSPNEDRARTYGRTVLTILGRLEHVSSGETMP